MSESLRARGVWSVVAIVLAVGVGVGIGGNDSRDDLQTTSVSEESYNELMARRVADIEELQEEYFAQREQWLPILPPDPEVTVTQPGQPAVLPFDPKRFPEEFLKGLAGIYENSVVVYPVTMEEDPLTRETVFVNGAG